MREAKLVVVVVVVLIVQYIIKVRVAVIVVVVIILDNADKQATIIIISMIIVGIYFSWAFSIIDKILNMEDFNLAYGKECMAIHISWISGNKGSFIILLGFKMKSVFC